MIPSVTREEYTMAFSEELHFASACRLLSMLRGRQLSSVELIRAFYDRIRELNPRLNAMVTLCEARAQRGRRI